VGIDRPEKRNALNGPLFEALANTLNVAQGDERAVAGVSLGGREHMVGPQAIHGELAGGMLRHLLQGTLGYLGYEVLHQFFAWHVPYRSHAERVDTLKRWGDFIVRLDEHPCMPTPRLEEYDEIFQPLPGAVSR
jgi:NAD(P)H dehydrogenase (quinone)